MIKDVSFLIIFNTMLGNIERVMCRNTLKTMIKEHDFEDYFQLGVQDIDYDEWVDYIAHARRGRQCVQLRSRS